MAKIKNGKLVKNYRLANISAQAIQYGLPISYVISRYGIYHENDGGRVALGSLILLGFIGYFLFKNNIHNIIKDINGLGDVAKKGKWGALFMVLAGIFALASYWIMGALWFLLVLGGSNLISLIPYSVYYKRKKEYDDLSLAIKNKNNEQQIKDLHL